jgi:pyruvate/2-oxoglutarate dehydrogenase complex dihydrolipoamide acyltransferase (E2) component
LLCCSAPVDGVVEAVRCVVGDTVPKNELLIKLRQADSDVDGQQKQPSDENVEAEIEAVVAK